MTESDKAAIHSLLDAGNTPLEAAEALNLDFRRVTAFCDLNKLAPRKFFIAKDIRKSTYADAFWEPND